MILDPALLGAYIVVATALALSPGPDVMFVVASGMRHKARGGIAAALGIAGGSLVHALAAALGVSALIKASPVAFDALRLAGAAYLFYLGVSALVSFFRTAGNRGLQAGASEVSAAKVFTRGLITNLLNPKVIVFYLALLPQFVNVSLGNVGLQMFLLGSIHNLIGLLLLIGVALTAGHTADWLTRTAVGRWLDGLAGLFFIGLAVRLAVSGRADPS